MILESPHKKKTGQLFMWSINPLDHISTIYQYENEIFYKVGVQDLKMSCGKLLVTTADKGIYYLQHKKGVILNSCLRKIEHSAVRNPVNVINSGEFINVVTCK